MRPANSVKVFHGFPRCYIKCSVGNQNPRCAACFLRGTPSSTLAPLHTYCTHNSAQLVSLFSLPYTLAVQLPSFPLLPFTKLCIVFSLLLSEGRTGTALPGNLQNSNFPASNNNKCNASCYIPCLFLSLSVSLYSLPTAEVTVQFSPASAGSTDTLSQQS